MTYLVRDLFEKHGLSLELELVAGSSGLGRSISVPEAHRPGLGLTGYLKNHAEKRLLIFGKVEMEYLRDLTEEERIRRLEAILTEKTPALIIARRYRPPQELIALCTQREIPLFRTRMITMTLLSKLTLLLLDEFAPSLTCHGTLVEVFGVGMLIQGDSAVGKSEAALGLVERGHQLVSDDLILVKRREGYLEGTGMELSRHHMEVRGIGIINVAHLYGAVCVQEKKSLDIVVKLEVWDDEYFYDRVGNEEAMTTLLGLEIPFMRLPVKPGRDVVLLLETMALNHRLKKMGFHSAKEFNQQLLATLARKGSKK